MGIFDRSRRNHVDLVPYYRDGAVREELEQRAWELGMGVDRDRYKLKQVHEHRRRGGALAIYQPTSACSGSVPRLINRNFSSMRTPSLQPGALLTPSTSAMFVSDGRYINQKEAAGFPNLVRSTG